MNVVVSTRRAAGKFSRAVKVTTNDPEHPQESLVCAATVRVPFRMQPPTASFGQLERSAGPRKKTFMLTRGDGGPLVPELLPVSSESVQATLREIEPGERYELDIEIKPPWPNQMLRVGLTLKTGVSEVPKETISVYARIAERVIAKPSRFSVPPSVRSDLDLKVRLVWSTAGPAKILEVTSSDPETSVSIAEANGGHELVLHIPAGYKGPPGGRGTVVVKTDDPEVPEYSIPVYVARLPRTAPPSVPSKAAAPGVKEPAASRTKPKP